MRLTEAEIKSLAASVARARSGGCSRSYNRIKQELEQQLKEDNDDPPEEPDVKLHPTYYNQPPTPEVVFVQKFFIYSFLIMGVLVAALVISSFFIQEVPVP